MTLSQRLTRAGLAFIVFGTAVALMPTDGNASASTDGCTTPAQSYSVGTAPQDSNTAFKIPSGSSSLTLTSYLGETATSATGVTDSAGGSFTTSLSGSTVTTTVNKVNNGAATTDTVTVTFPGGRTVQYTVND